MKRIIVVLLTVLGVHFSSFCQWQQTGTVDTFAIKTLTAYGNIIFTGTDGAGIYTSSDEGNSWILKDSGFTNLRINAMAYDTSGTLYAGSKSLLLFTSVDTGNTWVLHNVGGTGNSISSIAVMGTNIFAGEAGDGVFLSTNSGASWAEKGLCCASVLSLCTDSGGHVYAGTNAGGVYRSVAPFTTWAMMNNGLPGTLPQIRALIANGSLIVAGTAGSGIFISTDNGLNWAAANNGLDDLNVFSLAAEGQKLFAGTESGGIFVSADQGLNWIQSNEGLSIFNVTALTAYNNFLFAGFSNGEVWKRPLAELTSVDEVSDSKDFEIYPNPVAEKLGVKINDFENSTISICSISGNLISLLKPQGPITVVEIEGYPNGIYFIQVQKPDKIQTIKFIKY
ncbi:MAG TPA: T9SS type A sorting domain-containing protein [Bacteroidales bacterium]|nr:T9SS type A sorting domain-containing protein [Bacteroidales bacterium]